ncbi:chitobiase/beta-hexosaminidase C-terminal domain-containing protein [Geotalea toluenoxydans]|uniref:chitobiase/beta-hexosaminidase C-terminal domain-containing protein n=1 Tax=Geotalea toluenoxydans TaxID=421624 RepID=UPI001FB49B50|nr:chitobiase/beta-hexosaminidase C-terminal domain-containing protein [Geotalea toluenoxydans]
MADGKIFILGGTPATASIISFDPAANSWSTRPSLTTPVFGGAAVAWGTTIYLMGGLDEQFNYLNSVIAYDTINGTSTPVGSLIYSRARMNAVLFNNKIYVVGGSNAETTIEEYDLAGNSSRVAGTLPEPTLLAGVAAYGDRIIIAGGGTGNTKTWSFDPATGSFTALASLPSTAEARNLIVNNDRLYLVESWGYDNINYIYEYNIGANTWSIATNVPTLRNVPMVEALNGLLYVMGGDDATGSKANEAWTLNSGWTVNSVNPYRSDMIDWPASQYGTVTVGTNIKIGSLYYYVTESDVPSWSGSGHVRAALSDCDQITGLPIGPANMIGSQGRPITYDTNPPSVTATPAGGTYAGPLTVTLTTDKPGTIYYTTDGTEPTSYSPVYSGPLYIAASTTLKFFARDAVNSEPVQTQVYSITVAEQGIINTVAGNGVAGFTGDGGTAVGSSLNYPEDAAVDLDGNIYIADSANNRIRRVDKASGSIATIAGNGLAEFSGDGGPAYMAGLNRPFAVALDTSGNIYISDNQNYRVRKIDMASFIITTVAGNGTSGATGDGGLATAASLGDIRGLAVDAAGSIYIADSGSNGIRKVEKTTGIITTIATGYHPEGVTLDRTGNLYYAETWGHVIVRIDKATSAKSIVAGNGMGGYSGDGGPATQASLYAPHRIVLDGSGNIYISDTFNHRIRKVNSATGLISTLAGTGTAGYSGDGGPATAAMIVNPRGLSIDSNGTIFFADSSSRVRAISGGTSDTNPPDTTATPPGGTYQAPQWVTLSANEPATIYYTVDGTLPTPASAVYGGPIYVGSSMTLQYFARDAAGNQEPVKSEYFTIKQDQYISFPVIDARTYGDAPFTLGATASSGLAISYTSDNLAVATVSGNTITIVGAGTVNITATQWGDYYYNSASPVIQTLTVHKSPATVALGNLSATYDGAAKTVSATTSPSGLSVTFTYNGAGTVPVAAGTYAVVGTISSANYQGSATGTMIIAPAATSISISQSSPNPSTYGQPVTISATVSPVGASGKVRFSNGIGWAEEVNVNPASGSASLSATMMPAGVNTITAQYTGDNNHLQSPVSTGVTQIVNKANQTISFAAIANKIAGGPEFTLNATATSALPVSFISSDPAVAQVSGNTVTIAGPGTVTIIASQWGDSNYNAANAVTQSFTVLPVEQGIKLIDNGIDSFFTTFSAAYNGITSGIGTSIRLPITTLTEILVFDKNHELIILGGYDPIGGTYSGVTTIQGSITIQNGTVIIAEPLSII